ncbi:DUF418 domain-containing protein [Paenibacillus sp. SC116]|uniref:DUF418 domain-containing protein n=1 Tax=Paenibacillus sp. SC116 TaxID=2968986 RepID=UPI00215B431F|nr:DUF418 domain-containing protein [Paenibacillus sp. SC116]MCR8842263.1 DUF418 domain-containing protein [Paenibacillus sp. SC116]
MENTQLQQRIDILDYLRGFALIGIIFMNIISMMLPELPAVNSHDAAYQRFLYLFVEGRFYSIFSFLFGVGFYIFITRALAKGNNGYILFLRRIAALFAIGFIHQMFQPGEALALYAICGLLLIPFYKLPKQINLIIAIVGITVFGYIGSKLMLTFPLILLGLAVGQYRIFERLANLQKQVWAFALIMLLLSAAGLWYQFQYLPAEPFFPYMIGGDLDPHLLQVNQFLSIGIMIGPIVSAAFVGILILLLQMKTIRTLLAPLKYYGRMALTNYLSQTALILLAAQWLQQSDTITYVQTFYICLVVHLILIVFSLAWLRFFKMGPMEWLWRAITYMRFAPLLKNSDK